MTIKEYADKYGLKQIDDKGEWFENEIAIHHADDIAAHILWMEEQEQQDKILKRYDYEATSK